MAKTLQTIIVTIPRDGSVHLDVDGVKGKTCLDITKGIEEALGGDVTGRKKKPAMFDKETIYDKTKVGV